MVAKTQDVIVRPDRDRAVYTAKEVARALKVNDRALRRMCAEGRVPFVTNADGVWWFTPKAVAFLKRFDLKPGGRMLDGMMECATAMLAQAVGLDPRCRVRAQQEQRIGRLSPDQIEEIRSLRRAGWSLDEIASEVKVVRKLGGEPQPISKSLVSLVVRGKRHAEA